MKRKDIFVLIIILMLIIFIILYMCFSFWNKKEEENTYIIMENHIKEAVEYKLFATNLNSDVVISFDNLISNGYLDKENLKDKSSYCDGYVLVKESDVKPCYKIYLKCNNYVTNGYDKMNINDIC